MSYTTVASVVSGNTITATWGNSVATAMGELQSALPQSVTTWSPTWTNLTVGNGTLSNNRYIRIGPVVLATLQLTWGTTTSISGGVSLTLPVNNVGSATPFIAQQTRFVDFGTEQYVAHSLPQSTGALALRTLDSTNATALDEDPISSAVPFTWTTSDEIHIGVVYWAA